MWLCWSHGCLIAVTLNWFRASPPSWKSHNSPFYTDCDVYWIDNILNNDNLCWFFNSCLNWGKKDLAVGPVFINQICLRLTQLQSASFAPCRSLSKTMEWKEEQLAGISLDCWAQFGVFDAMPSYSLLAREDGATFWRLGQGCFLPLGPLALLMLLPLGVLLLSVPLQPLAHDVELGVGSGSVGLFGFSNARAVPRVTCFSRAPLQACLVKCRFAAGC